MKEFIFNLITFFPRRKYEKNWKKKISTLESTLDTIREEKARSEKLGSHTLEEVYNTTIYMILFHLDLDVLTRNLATEYNETVKRVYSKQIASQVHEFFNDFPQIFGEKLQKKLKNLPNQEKHLSEFKSIGRELRQFRKDKQKQFHQIRNIIGSHRDLNGDLQVKTLENINNKDILSLCAEMQMWLNKISILLHQVIEDYRMSPIMVKEISRKIDEEYKSNKTLGENFEQLRSPKSSS